MKTIALIVAAGSSSRFGGSVPKQFRELDGMPLLSRTIGQFEAASSITQIAVVVAEEHLLYVSKAIVDPFGFPKVIKIIPGGATRQESVRRGLSALPLSTDFVAIHDGARPLTAPEDIDRVVATAQEERAAMLAIPTTDTIKRAADGYVLATLDRRALFLAQTPQVFQYDLIKAAHDEAAENGSDQATDDAALIEAKGFKVRIVEPSHPNPKVTTHHDLEVAEFMLGRSK
jgi:2-C-methyl-D-erythritol 4-phosphate cytidylyltransferase